MTSWIRGVCRANGVDIHFRRTGGVKPPLLLLHGLTGSGACWTPLARRLEDAFDVVMPDARGHGESSAPPNGYRYEDHAADVLAFIERLGLVHPTVLGHSMGGMTAALVANHLGEGLSGVILVDPTFISEERQRELHDSGVAEQHRRVLGRDKAGLLEDLRVRHPRRSLDLLELLAEARLQTRLSAFDVLTPPSPDYRQVVRGIHAPAVLVIGDAGIVSLDTAKELQTLNRRVRLEQIEGAGHGIPYDEPERLESIVRSHGKAGEGARFRGE